MVEYKTDFNYIGYDCTFELDQFAKPRLRSEPELVKNTILFILFTKPGQYPSLPFIGLDIQNLLYMFYDDIDTGALVNSIYSQCKALGVHFRQGNVNIRKIRYKGQPSIMIHMEIPSGDTTFISDATTSQYQIGITFNELNDMIYNVTEGRISNGSG